MKNATFLTKISIKLSFMLQIYTGPGKGKTTASLGLALRALGHNMNVLIIQFLKGNQETGEFKISKKIPSLTIKQFGPKNKIITKQNFTPNDIELANKGLNFFKNSITKFPKPDIIILDEINNACNLKLIKTKNLIPSIDKAIKNNIEIILTGRNAPKELLKKADLVSEIKEIKHYFNKNKFARKGIEY